MERPVVVLKVGTSSLVDVVSRKPKVSALSRLAEASSNLVAAGFHVIIVSSGAVGLGCSRIGLKEKPSTIAGKQAAAAVGQVRLMSLWDHLFDIVGRRVAQVLLTYDTFGDRTQYLNARNTMWELLKMDVVPIVNENDTVAVQELRVGDNDTLSALVAAMVSAQWLFLFTDVDSLFDANPRDVPSAAPIRVVPPHSISDLRGQMMRGVGKLALLPRPHSNGDLEPLAHATGAAATAVPGSKAVADAAHSRPGCSAAAGSAPTADSAVAASVAPAATAAAGGGKAAAAGGSASPAPVVQQGKAGSEFGTGGMATKLKAAQLASAAGVTTVITHTDRVEEVVGVLAADGAAAVAAAVRGGRGARAAPAASPAVTAAAPSPAVCDGGKHATQAAGTSRAATAAAAAALSVKTDGSAGPSAIAAAAASIVAVVEPEAGVAGRRGSSGSPTALAAQAAAGCGQQHHWRLLFAERGFGSTFLPSPRPVMGRKRWILGLAPAGRLVIDAGAVAAVVGSRKSLFPAGILRVEGDFDSQDAVSVVDGEGCEVARALVNYTSFDLRRIRGKRSKEVTDTLGYPGAEAVADRDNIVLTVERDGHTHGHSHAAPPRGSGSPAPTAADVL
jgi:glutamate 5-kinase